jgi:hypothetical protein
MTGSDYAFVQLPSTLQAGPTLFSFENRGTKRHEMSIALLRTSIPADSVLSTRVVATVSSRVR